MMHSIRHVVLFGSIQIRCDCDCTSTVWHILAGKSLPGVLQRQLHLSSARASATMYSTEQASGSCCKPEQFVTNTAVHTIGVQLCESVSPWRHYRSIWAEPVNAMHTLDYLAVNVVANVLTYLSACRNCSSCRNTLSAYPRRKQTSGLALTCGLDSKHVAFKHLPM